MSSVYNYTFDSMSRMGYDVSTLSEKNKQNTHFGSYALTDYFANDCGLKKPVQFATKQADFYVHGGNNTVGKGGCAVNDHSELTIGSIQTNPKARISLYTRPFVTVPYLGKGSVNVEDESLLIQGQNISSRKSSSTMSETSYIDHHHYPLVDHIRKSVTNPNNLVEGVAKPGWIRGGLSSRDSSYKKQSV